MYAFRAPPLILQIFPFPDNLSRGTFQGVTKTTDTRLVENSSFLPKVSAEFASLEEIRKPN